MQGDEGQEPDTHLLTFQQALPEAQAARESPEVTSWSCSRAGPMALPCTLQQSPGWRPKGPSHTLSHSPMHTSDKLLQLPHAGPGFKLLHTRLPVSANVHVELRLVSLGVHQARLAGQDEWAQPDGVDLGRPGRRVLVLSLQQVTGSWPARPTLTQREALQHSFGAPSLAAHFHLHCPSPSREHPAPPNSTTLEGAIWAVHGSAQHRAPRLPPHHSHG